MDTREDSILAYHEVLEAIVMETKTLRGLTEHPRKFFVEALRRIKYNKRRKIGLNALITWVRWNAMLAAADGTSGISAAVHKRIKRSKDCSPAGVVVEDHRYRRCEMYICPMCWYRHTRDRLASLTPVLETQPLGKLIYLVGRVKQESKLPSREVLANLYELAGQARETLGATGALTSVRLWGEPGHWVPAVSMLVSGTGVTTPEAVNVDLERLGLRWTVFHASGSKGGLRGGALKRYIAEVLRYPVGIFDPKLHISELANLFDGNRLVRSSVSGIMMSRLRDGVSGKSE